MELTYIFFDIAYHMRIIEWKNTMTLLLLVPSLTRYGKTVRKKLEASKTKYVTKYDKIYAENSFLNNSLTLTFDISTISFYGQYVWIVNPTREINIENSVICAFEKSIQLKSLMNTNSTLREFKQG